MLDTDRTALYCDLAETYHVFGFESLPVTDLAMLASGLRDNSRIKQKMSGITYPPTELILARMADTVSLFRYGFMEDKKGKNMPYLFTEHLREDDKTDKPRSFMSGAEFDAAWRKAGGQ